MKPAQAPDFTYSCQASAKYFEQCAEFLLLCNRSLGPLTVTVLPIALARSAAATPVESTAPLFCRWRPAWLPACPSRC